MVSASETINAKLEAWSKTKAGQKVLAAAGKKALLGAIRNGEKPKDADKLADEMKTVLLAHLPDSLKSLTMSDFEEPEFKITDEEAVMIIRFLSKSVSRPSLDPKKYPNGIADIVVHLDHGWDAKHVTGGLWHGEYHLRDRISCRMPWMNLTGRTRNLRRRCVIRMGMIEAGDRLFFIL